MSIKYKIAILFAALVSLILAGIGIAVYFFSVKERQDTFSARLKNRALSTAKVYSDIRDSNYSVLSKMDEGIVASLYNRSIAILNYDNRYDYVSTDIPGDSLLLSGDIIERVKIEGDIYFKYGQRRAFAIHQTTSNNNFILAIAASDIDGKEFLDKLKKILLVTGFVSLLISFLVGLVFAKRLIKPVNRIIGEVNLITSNNLSQRIKIHKAKDELSRLSETFNSLLDRLSDSFAIQRRFISNASHEFSTPLTSISSQLEVTLQKSRNADEYREVIESVQEDIVELQQLTRSLLDIAKTGSQGGIDLVEVRVDEVLFKVISEVKKQNASFKVKIDFGDFPEDERLLTVFGNGNLLFIAFKNIVENGCKYSDNLQSDVFVIFGSNDIQIMVSNKGDVIAESDIQNIFHPFFRTPAAQNKPGFGLGLTLTRRILSLHRGTIAVESDPERGTIFTVQLPNVTQSR